MNKIKISLITVLILSLLPLVGFAQFDFDINDFLFDDTNAGSYINITKFDLNWSADTYTPYEYQGRALPSQGSKVFIEAVIEISGSDINDLKYSWFLDDIFQGTKSGYGKDGFYFYVNQRPGNYQTVRLQIFNEDRSIFEEKSVKIPIVVPELVIHFSNGNSYFSDQASKISLVSADKNSSFVAKPYFFSIKKLTDLEFEWHFADQEPVISSAYDASVLNLTIGEKEGKELSENSLWVSVKNKTEPRQTAYQTINIQIY